MANETDLADQNLTTELGVLWMEQPWHYRSLKTPPRHPGEYGPTTRLPDDEMLSLVQLVLEAYNMPQWLPIPPDGIPGIASWQHVDDDVMDIIRDGARYLVAYLNGERRTLWNIHEKIAERMRKASVTAADEARAEVFTAISRNANIRSDPREGLVYFIRSEAGPIKIGKANDPEARLRTLQTSHFAKLDIAATCEGGLEQEGVYHKRFAEHRLEGEWFEPHPDILAEIDRLNG